MTGKMFSIISMLYRLQVSHLILFVILFSVNAMAGELKVSTDHSSGSGEVLMIDQATRLIKINPTEHENRGWVCWWYFKLTGISPGETITLHVGKGSWATPLRAAFSIDNKSWSQTVPGIRQKDRIIYTQIVDTSECWFAWGPPFVPVQAKELIDEVVRTAVRQQARDLEKHLGDIDRRLKTLEKRR